MTCELVTGSSGTEHVSSADAGSMYASVFGAGRYAVNQGDNFAAELASANSVQIGTGACFIDGRYFRVTSPETVSFDSGAQGVSRIDLVGVKYTYNSGTGVETGVLDVVKGTATSGTPVEPTYTDGNILEGATQAFFPLYSITIPGVNPEEPVKLFKVMTATVACPWPIGAVLQMTNGNDPNSVYPGTTWQKITGKFLLGSSSGHTLGQTGGAETVTLTENNLPAHSHTYNKANETSGATALTVGQLPNIAATWKTRVTDYYNGRLVVGTSSTNAGAFDGNGTNSSAYDCVTQSNTRVSNAGTFGFSFGSGESHTHSVGAVTSDSGNTGSGTAVNTMPPYKVVHMWERVA